MQNRYGKPVKIEGTIENPFILVDADIEGELLAVLNRRGFTAAGRGEPAILDGLDPTDPGEAFVDILPGGDLDALQDFIDSIERDSMGHLTQRL